MQRTYSLIPVLLAIALFPSLVSGQSVIYEWLNQPCDQNLNCANGCSACNLPANGSVSFLGTNVVWTGVQVCPHVVAVGDNAINTEGWPITPDPLVFVGLSAIALEPLQVDSIILRHRRSADGPQRLRILYTNNVANVTEQIDEVDVSAEFQETVITDLGCLEMNENSVYSGLQLRIQAFQGGGGAWQLDALRIVGSPCNASQVGISETFERNLQQSGSFVDVIGRPVQGNPVPGVYIGARKRVQIY